MLFMGEEWGASTPWQFFTDHTDPALADAVRSGRRAEFASHGWAASDVPDPQAPATFEASKLDWSELGAEPHARLLRWYRDLIALRRRLPDLRGPRCAPSDVAWDAAARTLQMRRGSVTLLANLGPSPARFDVAGEVLLAWSDGVGCDADGTDVPAQSVVVLAT
jgi:maltooligosyltrehalose trehalohydrolase